MEIEKKKRNSSIEVLRILSMIMIIISHYCYHGVINVSTLPYSINKIILQLGYLGNLGVNIFFLISSYFMYDSKFNIKKFLTLVFEIFSYSMLIYLMFIFIGLHEFNITSFIQSAFPIIFKKYWFATVYMIIYLISPFLNIMIKNLSKKQHLQIILITLFIWSGLYTFMNINLYNNYFTDVFLLYFISTYMKKYSEEIKKYNKHINIFSVVCAVILFLITIIFSYSDTLSVYVHHFYARNSIFIILIAVGLFNCFLNKEFYLKIINLISTCIFGVYLLHDNNLIRPILWNFINNQKYQNSSLLFIHLIVSSLLIFITCVLIEFLRKKTIQKIGNKIVSLILIKIDIIKKRTINLKVILNWLNSQKYLIYFSIGLYIGDFYVRFINRTMKSFSVMDLIPNAFTIFWILLFVLLLYIIKNKILKRIFSITLYLICLLMTGTQIIYSKIFSSFFTFKSILNASEAFEFKNVILQYVSSLDIFLIIIMLILLFASQINFKKIKIETNKVRKMITRILIIFLFGLYFGIQMLIGKPSDTTNWAAFSNKRNIYNQFNDTKRAMMLCGLYEYTFKDFYVTFMKPQNIDITKVTNEISEYFKAQDKIVSSMNGLYKDKNLILIMLENIDTWMITKESMPYLYNIQENGINFTNHYSVNYASGFTFNTEFIANVGLIPNINELRTSYSYNQNNYDYALASLFKQEGYLVNSLHKNKGQFYNRDNMHMAWGYTNHYDYSKLAFNGKNSDLDSTIVSENLKKFIYDQKFMTFFITYSAHMPFQYSKPECQENLGEIQKKFKSDNEEYLCAMSQARDTDNAIKILVEELNKKNIIDNTVLIFFTDHYAYSMDKDMVQKLKNETDENLLTKTPFFIYDNGKNKMKVDKVNSSLDILPTIADLFGLDYNPNIYFGESIFSDAYNGLVIFNDNSWYDGKIYYPYKYSAQNKDYVEKINKHINNVMYYGGRVIETDYFKYYNLQNERQ